MQNDYECPRCHNVFPTSNKIMHDAKCTDQNPLPLNKNNNVVPPPIENKEEYISSLSELISNINMNNDNDINNNDNNNFDNSNNNFNNDNYNDALNNINEPPKEDFPQIFECEICHQVFEEKERNDHMLCHNLEKEEKKKELRISQIDIEEQKKIEKQIENNNKKTRIHPHIINQDNNFNNNNIDDINFIPNINNNNNNRRNDNNSNRIHIDQYYYNNVINPNNNNNNVNINLDGRMEIREGGPNVEVNTFQNNNNNIESLNVRPYSRIRYINNNNNNFLNYNSDNPNIPIRTNRIIRPRFRLFPFGNNNYRDNTVRATDEEILNNLPETQIEDVSKLDQEKKNCVICLEDFKNGDKAIILPCIHIFHNNCIKFWLKTKNTCPICKFKLTGSNINSQNNNFQ